MASNRQRWRVLKAKERSHSSERATPAQLSKPHEPRPAIGAYPVVEAEELISLGDLWRVLSDYRWVFLAVAILTLLATLLAASLMTPVYRADVLLAPVSAENAKSPFASELNRFGGMVGLAGFTGGRDSDKNEAIATLKSRAFTEQFISEQKLLPILFDELWDASIARWQVSDPDQVPSLWDAYTMFDKEVRRVREDRATGLVTLTVEWKDPELAAEWANRLVQRVNAVLRDRAVAESESKIGYLREELKKTSAVELQQLLHRLIEAEMKDAILTNIDQEFAFRVIDPALVPEKALKPVIWRMAIFGTILSILAGLLVVLAVNGLRGHAGSLARTKLTQ